MPWGQTVAYVVDLDGSWSRFSRRSQPNGSRASDLGHELRLSAETVRRQGEPLSGTRGSCAPDRRSRDRSRPPRARGRRPAPRPLAAPAQALPESRRARRPATVPFERSLRHAELPCRAGHARSAGQAGQRLSQAIVNADMRFDEAEHGGGITSWRARTARRSPRGRWMPRDADDNPPSAGRCNEERLRRVEQMRDPPFGRLARCLAPDEISAPVWQHDSGRRARGRHSTRRSRRWAARRSRRALRLASAGTRTTL